MLLRMSTRDSVPLTRLLDAQSVRLNLWCKEVVRELENDQHVSLEASVFRFPFFFPQSFWV